MSRTALLAGSTGLIGKQLLELLLKDEIYGKVIAISRQPLNVQNKKLQNVICSLDQLQNHSFEFKADDVFCCFGTTIKKAKTQKAFRAVDFEAPLALAEISKANRASQFLLVSALGANKNSNIFYNRVKGEIEEAIDKVGFLSYHIFRPSLLLGSRSEQRSGEDAAKIFYKIFGWMIPAKYQAIDSMKVANAMISLATKSDNGKFIHESNQIQNF